ncbi:sensory box histidine kinase [Vibrio sp. JCM 19236]|nr:sensory box histidine kinase [Vibrio sp. JCM 19236]
MGIDGRAHPEDESRFIYHFYVQDTGIGIATDKLDKLFDSFQQADASTTREYGGTGLGLSICKQIIELMGGKIWVESELGKGSVFHFEVEMEVAESNVSLFSTLQPAINTLAKKQVLLLEPDRYTSDAVNMALTSTPISTRVFTQFELLIDELRRSRRDSVTYVSDAALKRNSIREQLAQLRSLTKLVLCTSSDEMAELAQGMRVSVLRRPFVPFEFITTLSGKQEQDSSVALQQQQSAGQILSGQSILLVEDNELNQELVLGLLEPYSLNIDVVENGQLAVEKAQQNRYSLILMDIQMPVLGGYEATRRIREFDHNTPIVAMTANAMVGDQRKAQQVGMNDFVPKPIDVDRLISVMTRLSSNSDANIEIEETEAVQHRVDSLFDPSIGLTTCGQDEYLLLKLLRKFSNNAQQRVNEMIKRISPVISKVLFVRRIH